MNYTEDTTITDIICEWQDSVPEDRYTAPKEESEYYYKLHTEIFYSDDALITFLLFCEDNSDAKPYNIPKKKRKLVKEPSLYDAFYDDDNIDEDELIDEIIDDIVSEEKPEKPHEEEIIL